MTGEGRVVFIVDDDEDDRLFLTEALLKVESGLSIIEAKNGLELIKIIQGNDFKYEIALIIIDLNMPLMNGIETIQALKPMHDITAIPILMLTTASDFRTTEQCLKAGFRECLSKPSSLDGILRLVERLKTKYLI